MIGFLQPLALLGLAAAAIPPLLHLLGRRVPPTIIFPAVRYLAATEREHSRRLRLRNLLLMLLRTAVILLLVLAAARPVTRVAVGAGHPPTALAVVVDNSLSAGAVQGGRPMLDAIVQQARHVIGRVGPDDRLWLVLADGVPRRLDAAQAARMLDSLSVWPVRLDVTRAARAAGQVVREQPASVAEVVIVSDLQATAFTAGDPVDVPALVWRSPPPPPNRGIDSAFALPRAWRGEGALIAAVGGDGEAAAAIRASLDGREVARGVVAPAERAVLRARVASHGWFAARLELEPDELRGDDGWWLALSSAPPVAATAFDGAGTFVRQAVEVLIEGARAHAGSDVVLDDRLPGQGATVLFPPADPALAGAVNRALAARGSPWRLAERVAGEWVVSGDVEPAADATVLRRHRLEGQGRVLARAGGEPWLVASDGLVIVASRMEPDWTDLPVRVGFVPTLDALMHLVATRPAVVVRATPGATVRLPSGVDAVDTPSGRIGLAADRVFTAPFAPGVYFLTAGGARDTVGALEVNHDPRESRLAQADPSVVRATLGRKARLVEAAALDRELFGGARRASLAGPLLGAALLAALAELWLAALGGGRRENV